MADKKFSELTTSAALTNDDIMAVVQMQSGALTSVKATLYAIAVHITKLAQYTSDLQTTDKTVIGAINELKRQIALIPGFNIVKVNSLPTEDIDTHTLYLVPSQDPEAQNSCDEYINPDGTTAGWELVGSTNIDLSDYYTKLEVDGLLADKLDADDFEASQTASANPITLETKQAGLAKSCVVEMNPIQDLSHGDPSPTNICPISGRTEASVTRTGKNEIDEDFLLLANGWTKSGGEYSGLNSALHAAFSGGYSGNIKFRENTQYTVSFDFKSNDTKITVFGFKYSDGTKSESYLTNTTYERKNFTSTINKTVVGILFSYGGGTTVHIKDFQLEQGSTATAYEPYTAETKTHQYSETIYGGVDDFVNGGATSNYAMVDMGDLTYTYAGNNLFTAQLSTAEIPTNDLLCSNYKTLPYSTTSTNMTDKSIKSYGAVGNKIIYIKDSAYSDEQTLKTAMSGVQLCYKLATPTTVQLSPEAITLLKGLNVISTDGDKVQVEFSDIPVGDYSVLLDYIKSLESRIQALEGGGNRTLALTKNILQEEKNDIIKEEPEELELEKGQEEEKEETTEEKTDEEPEHSAESK